MSSVEGIHLHAGRGDRMRPVREVRAEAGEGLAGDERYHGLGITGTHITLVAAEVVESVVSTTGIPLTGAETRRNILTRGVDLDTLVGRRFRVGEAVCFGVKPCRPCEHLELTTRPGVRVGLAESGGGGLRADVVEGGTIRVGDPIQPLTD